jgi:putative transposase
MALREFYTYKYSVLLLFYHLILVMKYRKRVTDGRVSAKQKEIFTEIGGKYGINLVEWRGEENYIYCLFKDNSTTALAKFINTNKYI